MSQLIVVLSLLAIGGTACCDDELGADIPSPDGARHAVVFNRGCGATTGFNTQISILRSGHGLHGKGNLWIADERSGGPVGKWGGPDVQVRWRSLDTVEVTFASRVRVFKKEGLVDGITAIYVQR